MEGPVLLCGLGRVGWRVLDYLRTAGVGVVAIDTTANPGDARLKGVRLVRGDCREESVLHEAGIRDVRGVIIATSDDLLNVSCALMVRRLAPDVRIVLRMFNQNLVNRLGKAVANVTALSVSALAAPLLALTATTGEVLAAFPVAAGRRQVAEIIVPAESKFVGRPVAEFDEAKRFWLLAHLPASSAPRVLLEIDPASPIQAGDRLVIAGEPNDVRKLIEPGWDDLAGVLWAGRIRRFGRMAYRTLSEMDVAVKICTAALLVVVVSSTAVYKLALGHSWPDSFYRTISIISTGSELGGGEYDGWGKMFVSFLKMFGTVLVAAFTAIFTNYLLRARLGGVLEVRRIPDSGHVVVIGLGNVGYGVVEELTHMNERPVVVERDVTNHFIPSCRRRGVPVIVGDATVRETLQQARVKEARAVIAATSTDLGNLEVSLLVAEMNEKQRVVVLLSDAVSGGDGPVRGAGEDGGVAAGIVGPRLCSWPARRPRAFDVCRRRTNARGRGTRCPRRRRSPGWPLASVRGCRLPRGAGRGPRTERGRPVQRFHVPVDGRGSSGRGHNHSGPRTDLAPRVGPNRLVCRGDSLSPFAREPLALQVRALRRLTAAEADALVSAPPFVIAEGQSRGEAEDLVSMLRREKVEARPVEQAKVS